MKPMAQNEDYLLDPVYTAKSFAAISGLISDGLIDAGSRVLYVHTGGRRLSLFTKMRCKK